MLLIKVALGSFLASVAFGVLFNIHYEKLWLAGFTGMIGGLVYQLSLDAGQGVIFANFLGAVAFTICAEIFARMYKTPVTTFIVCALIPLVPGAKMYEMVLECIKGNPNGALSMFLDVLAIAGVLAVAILVVETITLMGIKLKKDWGRRIHEKNR